MKKIFMLVMALFTFIPLFTFAQEVKLDSLQTVEFSKLKNDYVNNIAVHWSNKKGTPSIITFSNPVFIDRDKIISAKKLLDKLHGIFSYRSKMDSLIIGRIREDDGDKYITFNQSYKDIPVIGGEYVVSVLKNGNVQGVLGSFYKNINLSTNPNINIPDALKIIMEDNINLKDSILSSKLVIFPKDTTYYLSWKMNIPNKSDGGVYTYYIDAKDGEILYKNDNVIYENLVRLFSPQPEANVYLHHPLIDQNYSYISPVDEINMSGYLQGTYANVLNHVTSRAYNSNRSFLFAPSNTHFDEANLYYHITKFRKDFWNVVDNSFSAFSQITANAHYPFSSPNASYSTSTGQLYFSDASGFSGYNDFAKEDKVIYHEYTHAVTITISGLANGYNESGAINEGNSDYFAGSFTDRSIIGEYASQGFSINIRDMTNPRIANYTQYNQSQSYIYNGINYGYHEPHFGGELWSASLWDLRKTGTGITQYYSDRLVYKALSAIPTNSSFLQYRQAIINKDNSSYSGSHVKKIEHVFYLRGIGTDSSGVTISGPSSLAFKETGNYTANVTGGSGQRTYQWYKSVNGGSSWIALGTSQTQTYKMSTYDIDLKCTVHDTQSGENAYSPIKHITYFDGKPKVAAPNNSIPKEYSLSNYPNPFNPSTIINYQLPKDGFVQLKIYDALGREVKTLVNDFKNAGSYNVTFDASDLPSGIYFYHLNVNNFSSTKKMLLLK